MGKKAMLFIIIGIVLGAALAAGGVYFMIQNGGVQVEEQEKKEPEFDLTQGKRLTLEKVQVPLASSGSRASYLQADFTIIFKTEEALNKANEIVPDIKDAIYGVFETKTADELRIQQGSAISPREAMKEPVLNAIKDLYMLEEDKEAIVAVKISSFIIG